MEKKGLEIIDKNAGYIGYIWLSNSENPVEYHNPVKLLLDYTDNSNPFIIEGQLYSQGTKKSYSIKYVDGKHIVIEYDLTSLPDDWADLEEKDIKRFVPNRIAASSIVFLQYWEPKPDELCENMKVLQPSASVFVGFEYEFKVKEEKL